MNRILLCGIALFAFIAMGCDGPKRPDGMPQLLPVTLMMTQDGNVPLAGAQITLSPVTQGENGNWAVGGTTDETGKAVIYTHGQFAGAPGGTYKVFLNKTKVTETVSYDGAPNDVAGFKRWESEHARELSKSKVVSCVEKTYTSVKTTPLEITVDKEHSHFELNAGKAVKEEIKLKKK